MFLGCQRESFSTKCPRYIVLGSPSEQRPIQCNQTKRFIKINIDIKAFKSFFYSWISYTLPHRMEVKLPDGNIPMIVSFEDSRKPGVEYNVIYWSDGNMIVCNMSARRNHWTEIDLGIMSLPLGPQQRCNFDADGLGKYYYERRLISLGIAIPWRLTKHCNQCKRTKRLNVDLRVCSRCQKVRYCSKHCQKVSWKSEHRFICK